MSDIKSPTEEPKVVSFAAARQARSAKRDTGEAARQQNQDLWEAVPQWRAAMSFMGAASSLQNSGADNEDIIRGMAMALAKFIAEVAQPDHAMPIGRAVAESLPDMVDFCEKAKNDRDLI